MVTSLPALESRPKVTYRSLASERLTAMWRAVMRRECPSHLIDLFGLLARPWGEGPIPSVPEWRSDIADDHSPIEFSVAFGGEAPEFRILIEAQGSRPTLGSVTAAGLELNRALEARGADLRRFRAVEDLFLPPEPS